MGFCALGSEGLRVVAFGFRNPRGNLASFNSSFLSRLPLQGLLKQRKRSITSGLGSIRGILAGFRLRLLLALLAGSGVSGPGLRSV